VREDFRASPVEIIYGTIRLIERDDQTLLAWAREPWACVIFNLHVVHTPDSQGRAADAFRRLIDHGLRYGRSYYLTYHRWATRRQVKAAHPRFVEFLRLKRRWDPEERFQSDCTATTEPCSRTRSEVSGGLGRPPSSEKAVKSPPLAAAKAPGVRPGAASSRWAVHSARRRARAQQGDDARSLR
jgi:hypothetical protein